MDQMNKKLKRKNKRLDREPWATEERPIKSKGNGRMRLKETQRDRQARREIV
jgi:hypothetical protein